MLQPVAKNLNKHLVLWWFLAKNNVQQALLNRWASFLFLLGKVVSLIISLLFLWVLKGSATQFGQYHTSHVIIFFLTYNWIDMVSQMIFRGVYEFGNLVRTGDLDMLLSKPVSILFRGLTGQPDPIDAVLVIPVTGFSIWLANQVGLTFSTTNLLGFALLLLNGFLIAMALHILIMVCMLITTDVDGFIWLYRDLSRLGQFPVTIYREPLRFLLFFLVPIGFMVTIPAEFLLNLTISQNLLLTLSTGAICLLLSLWGWRLGLRKYTSASS